MSIDRLPHPHLSIKFSRDVSKGWGAEQGRGPAMPLASGWRTLGLTQISITAFQLNFSTCSGDNGRDGPLPLLWAPSTRGSSTRLAVTSGGWLTPMQEEPLKCSSAHNRPKCGDKGQSLLSCAMSHAKPPNHQLWKGCHATAALFLNRLFILLRGSASEMAPTGVPCCFIFQVSLFKANGKLRGTYVYNWGVKLWSLHSAWNHKAHFSPNKLDFCKMLRRGRAKFWPWPGGVPTTERGVVSAHRKKIFAEVSQ